jgi:hypothetical protein
MKGVYHINAVDEVTQWEVVGAAEQISEFQSWSVIRDEGVAQAWLVSLLFGRNERRERKANPPGTRKFRKNKRQPPPPAE